MAFPETLGRRSHAGYFRSLTRRMQREAGAIAARSEHASHDLSLTFTASEPVTEIFHGVPVTDPYRWLEDQNAPRTRDWIEQQRRYARAYLDGIPARDRIRSRIREFLDV